MKSLLLSIFTLLCITSFSQSSFESEADVLLYLTQKSPFTNESTGTKLRFSDMGSTLIIGQSRCYNPEVTVISSTRAVVVYESISNPDAKIQFIVDSRENIIMDKQNRSSIYKANSYQVESLKPVAKPATKKKSVTSKKKTSS